ncbi:hypothetical protein [Limnoraphis robusta]|uniref:hypothetical protein n=1 Tax=Limnoraphis robusta TaxID=1118279 RepID=UPI00128F61F6|nr:hypothetical protein [Limnoraphis robusta]
MNINLTVFSASIAPDNSVQCSRCNIPTADIDKLLTTVRSHTATNSIGLEVWVNFLNFCDPLSTTGMF